MELSFPTIELVRVGSPQAWTAFHAIRRKVLWDNRGRTAYETSIRRITIRRTMRCC